ncbi:MAG: hypothetical protein QOF21_1809 [Actinomycetota bacterium]|jgi:hypothetical protein
MAEEKTPLERLIETAVYAPLGIAALIREELPKLVSRGQQEANMAKMMGKFAVGMGRQELEKRLTSVVDRGKPAAKPTPAAPAAPASPPAPATPSTPVASAPAAPAPAAPSTNGQEVTVHDANSLAIPGYDSLSASQVVQRLAGLNPAELAAIGSYEAAGRGRRTILNRVAQLRDA